MRPSSGKTSSSTVNEFTVYDRSSQGTRTSASSGGTINDQAVISNHRRQLRTMKRPTRSRSTNDKDVTPIVVIEATNRTVNEFTASFSIVLRTKTTPAAARKTHRPPVIPNHRRQYDGDRRLPATKRAARRQPFFAPRVENARYSVLRVYDALSLTNQVSPPSIDVSPSISNESSESPENVKR